MVQPEKTFKKLQKREPKWLVSFADLMSLLLALFVLILSFSEINSDSFRRNAGPISEAFNAKPKIINIIPTDQSKSSQSIQLDVTKPHEKKADESSELARSDLIFRLSIDLADQIAKRQIQVLERDFGVVIRFRDNAAFDSGSRELKTSIVPTLERITQVLARTKGKIRVEGHTDDIPISTDLFRDNWDLSAARAASVVRAILANSKIDPKRLSAQGFADSQPLVPNDTPEGRAKNRRVEVSIQLPKAGGFSVDPRFN